MASIAPDKTLMVENIALQVWLTPITESTNTVTVSNRTYAYSPNCHKSRFNTKPWIIKFYLKESSSEEIAQSRVKKDIKKDIELIEEVFNAENVKHESFDELISQGRAVVIIEENEYIFEQTTSDDQKKSHLESTSKGFIELEPLSSSANKFSEKWIHTFMSPTRIGTNWSNINVFIQSKRGLGLKPVLEHLSKIDSVTDDISMTRPPEILGFSLSKLPNKPRYYCPITELPLNRHNAIQIKTRDIQTRQNVWKTVSRTGVRQLILSGPSDFTTQRILAHTNELTTDDLRSVTRENLTSDSVLTELPKKASMPVLSE